MNHKHFLHYTRCTVLDIHAEIHTKKAGNERKLIVFESSSGQFQYSEQQGKQS